MKFLEISAMIFTLICVYLTAKQNIWCWFFGIVAIILFFIIYFNEKIYLQAILQIIFFIANIFGWYKWGKGLHDEYLGLKITQNVNFLTHIIIFTIISIPMGRIMNVYTDSPSPYIDAISSSIAILATHYMGNKYLEGWILWMVVNTLVCGMMLYQGLYIIAILEVVLFLMSIKAYFLWKKDLKTDFA